MFIVNRTFSTFLSFDIFDELDLLSGLFSDFFRLHYFIFQFPIDFGMLCASINA